MSTGKEIEAIRKKIMTQPASNFDALEKQFAKDALEKALKDLHGEITREIERNKTSFSEEIKKSLANLNGTLEKHISDEIDRKLPILLARNFSNISEEIKSNFNEMFLPIVTKAEKNMERLENQGDKTLRSWGNMMKQFESLWTKPFFLMLLVSILVGTAISLLSSYFLGRGDLYARQSCENTLQWYSTKYFDMKKAETAANPVKPDTRNQPKSRNQSKKKQK